MANKEKTLKQYLNSREFKKEYGCWYGANKLYDMSGELIDTDKYELYDDEVFERFSNQFLVMKVEQGWELGCDGEMYAFAKIYLNIYPRTSHRPIEGYYTVEFYDDDGNCKNHWLSESQTYYFYYREEAEKHIETIKSWNAISFTQTLIKKVR